MAAFGIVALSREEEAELGGFNEFSERPTHEGHRRGKKKRSPRQRAELRERRRRDAFATYFEGVTTDMGDDTPELD